MQLSDVGSQLRSNVVSANAIPSVIGIRITLPNVLSIKPDVDTSLVYRNQEELYIVIVLRSFFVGYYLAQNKSPDFCKIEVIPPINPDSILQRRTSPFPLPASFTLLALAFRSERSQQVQTIAQSIRNRALEHSGRFRVSVAVERASNVAS